MALKKWTPEKVLEEIKKLEDKSASWNHKNNSPLYNAAITYFGSWKAAVRACGYDYYKVKKVSNKRWSKEDIEFLKNNYRTLSTKEIAKLLGRTENSINTYRHKYSLKVKVDPLTEDQKNFIRKNYKVMSDEEMAEYLDEKISTIHYFRVRENLKKSNSWDKDKVIAEILTRYESGTLSKISASEPLYAAARRGFGSWRKAIEASGLNPDEIIKKKVG